MLMSSCFFIAFIYLAQAFLVVVPTEFWCKLPQVKDLTAEQLRDFMIPSAKMVPYEGHHLAYSRCWVYDIAVEKAIAARQPDANWPVKKCNEWEFKLSASDVPYISVAAEQKWVCDESYKATLAQSIFFMGSIVGGIIFGWLADKYGRVPILIATNVFAFVGGICTIYITKFWEFCICRFIVGVAYDNSFVMAYILVLEYVGPRWRTFIGHMSYGIFYTIGTMTIPWIAYGVANWQTFSLITTVPICAVIAAPFVLPESVRWLIGKGHIEKAMKIISKIEKVNNRTIPNDVYNEFLEDCGRTAETLAMEEHTILDLFKTKRLRRITLLLTAVWGAIQMAYDGHIRCLDRLGMNIFTTFTIASATEFPAEMVIIYTLDVFGRRWTLFVAVILSGLFSLLASSVSIGIVFVSFAICGRLFINIASNIAMQYAAELLPTVIRGEGVAFIHMTGYVTSICSPFIAFSSEFMYNLPMIILGTCCIFAGSLSLFLPETLMEQLPQTMMDGELFGIDQTFWETPLTKKKPPEPMVHHLHAKRPVKRPAILRSSMISGYIGNVRRHTLIQRRVRALQRH
ncbi:carcinine transporter-like [Bombus bifarius]|uniref:Carcinine transporter-like n=1 Tax=Bombus bifarius TaxID=103933 RepID=A0A6P8MFB6_9HYME|nr:carcinine transporter-like [Bombus bifarius]